MYKQPPITEAVIGINFQDQISEADLSAIQKKFLLYYPHHQAVESLSFKIELEAGENNKKTANTNMAEEIGHRCSTVDMTELIVLLPKSIIVSQLAPYPGWDTFFARFVRDWKMLQRVLGYRQIQRLGVRYINRIDIPTETEIVEHEKYLSIYPNITNKFGPLTAYAVQTELFMNDLQCKLTINSAAVPSPILNHASFVIDQDIAREVEVPQNNSEILSLIEKIRIRKNEVFEECVTDQARGLFKNE